MRWKFHLHSKSAWDAMLSACEQAQESIDLELYIFHYDEIGAEFIRVFERKAHEGVKIRLLLDAAGSFSFFNSAHAKRLVRLGVEIRFYNPISPWRINNIFSWFLRDHRKILIIDGALGFTGGVNISSRMRDWRDTHVEFRGDVVGEMERAFLRMWQFASIRTYTGFKKPTAIKKDFSFLTNSPKFRQRFIYRELLKAVRHARTSIYCTTAYFVPSLRFFRALRRAARRGVDVRILIPYTSDGILTDFAARSFFSLALKSGIKIYRYQRSFLHAKVIVVDESWATVGSVNLDNLSLLFNYEGNLVSTNPRFIAELKHHFFDDIKNAVQVDFRAWVNRSWHQKMLENATWFLHGFL